MARKTDEQKLEELQTTRSQITEREKAIMARIRSKKRKQDARRKIIAGAIALEHSEIDREFGDYFFQILKNNVKRPEDRELLGLPALKEKKKDEG